MRYVRIRSDNDGHAVFEDGEVSFASAVTRSWGPGDVFLLEDTSPPGHATAVFEDAVLAVVRT